MKKKRKKTRHCKPKRKPHKASPVQVPEEKKAPASFARRLMGVQDNINTDYVISGRYKFSIQNPQELARHIFEDIDETFVKRLLTGDYLIAGENFGCGSSREQAPLALKAAGIKAVIAQSFARIFYRNSFNIGLTLVECNTKHIDDGDEIELDLERSKVRNISKGLVFDAKALSPLIKKLLLDGGVIEHFKKYGGFSFEAA